MGKALLPEGAAPATPAAGYVAIYAKTDGLIYIKDDAGTETALSGGGGGSYTDTNTRATALTGLTGTSGTIAAADSILTAFGKVLKALYTDFAANVIGTAATGLTDTSGTPAAADSILTILGKIKKAFFTDHTGAGGSVHANVVAGGAAGFMSGTDKTKTDLLTLAAAFVTSGAFSLTLTSSATTNATLPAGTNNLGYLGAPINSQSTAYTAVASDAGKVLLHPSADANARTFTIPANASVAYEVGTIIGFANQTSQVLSIAITTDTMTLVNTTTTGTRSLAQNGMAAAQKVSTTGWIICGTGLT